ncbi:ABC transporter ATP-binding protein [Sporolactobacillus terrae]|uniref:Dipeptide/oligopeptide/nickel ABC transporter ATP-binding protein n=1 Tax=Sporolactobacillus terrae TaxID=269673 RepID=A0ABX5Q4V8_9BACL|nr:dipeptide ABC transporter ATP-binding protein [Sporolactobacillus terrae]QAA21664.1 dipeptide/oligopeptide/nickel ABC transporter ATP-binding protein [Sporolactobacillus terrae]QAA24636.1 dipeptide/oligopeptide/nickel ABC transporter ATP-binding protein [Sporolactobacillus terrae]UAK16472.1 dipeptide ABC transporter ATP-binding protein [Sporolactobacillus terrae]
MREPLVTVRNLKKYYPIRSGFLGRKNKAIKAVDNISFDLKKGETFGLVGESGCGKSTTGRMLMMLTDPTEGTITFEGKNMLNLKGEQLRKERRSFQMIFQDPYASLNPKMTIRAIIEEPLIIHGFKEKEERSNRVDELMKLVGLNQDQADRHAHEFSGGQRQRIGIARALALNPQLIIADEPVSALDVSIQAQIVNLLQDLQKKLGLTYLFISHDLSIIEHISDRIAVMYLGNIVELSTKTDLYAQPLHPYTQALISAIPRPDPLDKREKIVLKGDIPSPENPPAGCPFHTRCPKALDKCRVEKPILSEKQSEHFVACHLYTQP